MFLRCSAATLAVLLAFGFSSDAFGGGSWPDSPHKAWFESLQRPDNDNNPSRDEKSRSCCGIADTVKTQFRVEPGDEKYPEDR